MKIITFKPRLFIICLAIAVAIVAIALCVDMSLTTVVASNGMTIVVDAGHGGRDGGVRGTQTDVSEATINLAIATSLEFYLKQKGYNVVMTRTNDDGLYGNVSSNYKLADMQARRDIINEAMPDLVVSIHQNSYPRREVRGAQVFYAESSEQSKEVAGNMKGVLAGILPYADREIKSADYYILTCTQYQSILIECGFLSNPEEEALLVTSSYQDKVAFAITAGIELSLNSNYNEVNDEEQST